PAVHSRDRQQRAHHHRGSEPTGLIEERLLRHGECHAVSIPDTAPVAGANAQDMSPRWQSAVNRLAHWSSIEPFRVDTVETVLHPNLLRRGDVDRGKVDLDVPGSR